jgi:hypothetical protein
MVHSGANANVRENPSRKKDEEPTRTEERRCSERDENATREVACKDAAERNDIDDLEAVGKVACVSSESVEGPGDRSAETRRVA